MANKLDLFIDLDGVVCDFQTGFRKAAGLDPAKTGFLDFDPWGRPITEFNVDFGHKFWLKLDVFPWAQDLLNLAAKFDPEYRIITSCVPVPGSASGKLAWLEKHFGHEVMCRAMLVINGHTKSPTTLTRQAILVDDREKNCQEWFEAGGIAYRWRERTADMIEESKQELTKLEEVLKEAEQYVS